MAKSFTLEDFMVACLPAMMDDAIECNKRLGIKATKHHGHQRLNGRREQVAEYLDQGYRVSQIARMMDENQSTISYDVKKIREGKI